ncbi:hypothetical protein HB364_17970 [Pseudoflavitalea sp. X16]|uniref:hypothetical protein n=1 Tax=Paraflavitalea devenefica TaxID=2716334 RepID=UPI001420A4ED|nr:hypothetical protein [Paraflavitalea devenefica]NII26983.1 hypothetical protein [Paraflavitalea devenefica]
MATKKSLVTKPKAGVTKLSAKDFTVNPTTGKVLISQDKIANLVQSNLNKVKGSADTKAITVTVGVDF